MLKFLSRSGDDSAGKKGANLASKADGLQQSVLSVKNIPAENFTGRIIIRTHKDKDREGARALLKAHHESTIFSKYAFSDKKFDQMADQIVAKPDHMVCLVAELNGEIVGLAWASAGSYSLSDDLILTTCHVVAVHPTKLGRLKRVKTFVRLIKGIKTWSQTRGADQVLVHVTTGTNLKATDRILKRAGAKAIGGGYVV